MSGLPGLNAFAAVQNASPGLGCGKQSSCNYIILIYGRQRIDSRRMEPKMAGGGPRLAPRRSQVNRFTPGNMMDRRRPYGPEQGGNPAPMREAPKSSQKWTKDEEERSLYLIEPEQPVDSTLGSPCRPPP